MFRLIGSVHAYSGREFESEWLGAIPYVNYLLLEGRTLFYGQFSFH